MARRAMLSSVLAAFVAMWAAPAAAGGRATVKIENFSFDPPALTIKAGTTVTWRNEDDIPHTVVTTNRVFKSKVMDTDDNASFTFTTPGSYEYFCSLHPHMRGTIFVEGTTSQN